MFIHAIRGRILIQIFVLLTNAARCILISKNKMCSFIFSYFCSAAYFCFKKVIVINCLKIVPLSRKDVDLREMLLMLSFYLLQFYYNFGSE